MTSRRDWSEPLVKRLIAKHNGMAPETIIERYADPHDSAIDREHIFVHLAVPTHPRRDDGTAEPDE